MNLADCENRILFELQEPGQTTPNVAPLAAPVWSSLTNPQFGQGVVDYAINKGYERMLADTQELGLVRASFTLPAVNGQFYYTFNPPSGSTPSNPPTVAKLWRFLYTPTGLNYTTELNAAEGLVSWPEFLSYTNNLWNLQTGAALGTEPDIAAVVPGNTQLAVYPAATLTTDILTFVYSPAPTAGAAICPTLVNPTDVPLGPLDTHEAIIQFALFMLWSKARNSNMAQLAKKSYYEEIARIQKNYVQLSPGDVKFFDLGDGLPAYDL